MMFRSLQVVILILLEVSLAKEAQHSKSLSSNVVLNDQFWTTLIQNVIDLFYRQRLCGQNQFGVLILGNPENLTLQVHPNVDNRPILDNSHAFSPSHPSEFGNYVAARPEHIPQLQDAIHAEDLSLGHIQRLWNNYIVRFHQTPTLLLLYSWIMPCEQCVQLILNYFNSEPYASVPHRVVAHTTEGYFLPYMTPERNAQSRDRLRSAGIRVITHRCYSLPPSNFDAVSNMALMSLSESSDTDKTETELFQPEITESEINELEINEADITESDITASKMEQPASDTHCIENCMDTKMLQGCLYSCLQKTFVCCCCKDSHKKQMTADFVNRFMADCRKKHLKNCAQKMIESTLGNACTCNHKVVFVDDMNHCLANCSDLPMSNPLNPKSPSTFTGTLQNLDDLTKYTKEVSVCKDPRMDSTLCSKYKANYWTAGSSLCREDTPCDNYGYSYKWCYTDYNKSKWDYCCTDACGKRGENYYWCNSGSTWQYCGSPGTKTVDNTNCLSTSPCGLHLDVNSNTDYYWCYVDNFNNYRRCCQPGFPCGRHGYSYNWCWTGYRVQSGKWNKCTK